MPTHALVRAIPATFLDAVVLAPPPEPIDLRLAREQHRGYVEALRGLGLAVIELPADEALPDGCFVEDTAVVAGGVALITRPGAPSRAGEVRAVREALGARLPLAEMGPSGKLDGGDVLRVGRTIFVGRSARTDDPGRRRLAEVFGPLGYQVREVAVAGLLHLKCACSRLDDETVLVAEGALDPGVFEGLGVVTVPRGELYAANCVAVGSRALVPAGFPATERALREAGFEPVPLPTSEIRKADGSLTCLSILF